MNTAAQVSLFELREVTYRYEEIVAIDALSLIHISEPTRPY